MALACGFAAALLRLRDVCAQIGHQRAHCFGVGGEVRGVRVDGGAEESHGGGGTPSPTLPRFAGEGVLNPLSREAGEGWGRGA